MHEARQRDSWNHTAAILASIHNNTISLLASSMNPPRQIKSAKAKSPNDFHPMVSPQQRKAARLREAIPADITALKCMLPRGAKRQNGKTSKRQKTTPTPNPPPSGDPT